MRWQKPDLLFADCGDLEFAAEEAARSVLRNQGQVHSAGSRVLVERTIVSITMVPPPRTSSFFTWAELAIRNGTGQSSEIRHTFVEFVLVVAITWPGVANHLDVVAIRIQHVGSVVIRMVTASYARRSVRPSSCT